MAPSGPFPTTLVFEFTGEDGATEVAATVTGRPTGVMRLFQSMMARTTQQNLDRAYPRLKQLPRNGSAASKETFEADGARDGGPCGG